MQLNTRNFIALLIAGVGIIYLYYGLHGKDTTIKTNTQRQIISSEGIETDTGKRLEIYTHSGSNWGMNPFGSGKPLTEVEEKPKFHKPNTEWKTRTLSGITYVFGEGNPKEVALPESEMIACNRQDDAPCNDNGAGYVDPLLEKLVYDVLSSPDWEPLLQNCVKDFRIVDSFNQVSNKSSILNYDHLINLGSYISVEEVFIINPKTGRKNISKEGYDKLAGLHYYIRMGTSDFDGNPLPGISKCVDTYGLNIANMLINIRALPWRGSRDIPISE